MFVGLLQSCTPVDQTGLANGRIFGGASQPALHVSNGDATDLPGTGLTPRLLQMRWCSCCSMLSRV